MMAILEDIKAICRNDPAARNMESLLYSRSQAILMQDVPDNTTVVGTPGRIVKMNGERVSIKLSPSEVEQIKTVKKSHSKCP